MAGDGKIRCMDDEDRTNTIYFLAIDGDRDSMFRLDPPVTEGELKFYDSCRKEIVRKEEEAKKEGRNIIWGVP